ncbi:hypothetical protein [Stutzerimonas nitrititolerans]|uniref:hypothetical protein n=1 Tax=Stutzerimonas nitrititolerans TaxID=2482751 RepID=UPI0028A75C0C|nr:hypothetical protein [Stutzerimonas nitrititolerans]
MRIYFSASSNGFYDGALFGNRTHLVPDPDWVRPTVEVLLQPGEEAVADGETVFNDTDEPLPLLLPDMSIEAPLVEVANPDCKLPDDAVEITAAQRDELLAGVSQFRRIAADDSGYPILLDLPGPSAAERLKRLLDTVDDAADRARYAVAGDPLRAVEYDRARLEAEQFAAADFQGEVPPMVAAWAIGGRTAQQAAQSIIAEATQYTAALIALRETRLAAKEQVRALMDAGEAEQAQEVVVHTIAAIEAAVAGIGNNAS